MNHWNKEQVDGWAKTNKKDTRYEQAGKGFSLTRGRGQNGHIREVLQGIAAQVCIKCI
jgi:P2-related tail formation protein